MQCGGMASDTEDATKVASLVQEAKKNYEKASDAFKAARQGSADAQVGSHNSFGITERHEILTYLTNNSTCTT